MKKRIIAIDEFRSGLYTNKVIKCGHSVISHSHLAGILQQITCVDCGTDFYRIKHNRSHSK